MTKEEIDILLPTIDNLVELNIFMALKIFFEQIFPKAKTEEEKWLYLIAWVETIVKDLEERSKQ